MRDERRPDVNLAKIEKYAKHLESNTLSSTVLLHLLHGYFLWLDTTLPYATPTCPLTYEVLQI